MGWLCSCWASKSVQAAASDRGGMISICFDWAYAPCDACALTSRFSWGSRSSSSFHLFFILQCWLATDPKGACGRLLPQRRRRGRKERESCGTPALRSRRARAHTKEKGEGDKANVKREAVDFSEGWHLSLSTTFTTMGPWSLHPAICARVPPLSLSSPCKQVQRGSAL